MQPGFTSAHLGLAVVLARQGDAAGSRAKLEAAVRSDPSDPAIRMELALRLDREGKTDEAIGHLRSAFGGHLPRERKVMVCADPACTCLYLSREALQVLPGRLVVRVDGQGSTEALRGFLLPPLEQEDDPEIIENLKCRGVYR